MIILPYEPGRGFPTFRRLGKLNTKRSRITRLQKCIEQSINGPESKYSGLSWWHWTLIALCFLFIIAGVAGFSIKPYNYIFLVLGIILAVLVIVLICMRVRAKKDFAKEGIQNIENNFGEFFKIHKVYENAGKDGNTLLLRQIRVSVRDEVKKREIKEAKKKKRERDKNRDRRNDGIEIGSDEFVAPNASHKKDYKDLHRDSRERQETKLDAGELDISDNEADMSYNYEQKSPKVAKFRSNLRQDPAKDDVSKRYDLGMLNSRYC